jgi:hypothetical protein
MNKFDLLFEAVKLGLLPIVRQLVESGIYPRVHDDYILKIASQKGQLDVVKYLISVGCDARIENGYVLWLANQNGHKEVYEFLQIEVGKLYASR